MHSRGLQPHGKGAYRIYFSISIIPRLVRVRKRELLTLVPTRTTELLRATGLPFAEVRGRGRLARMQRLRAEALAEHLEAPAGLGRRESWVRGRLARMPGAWVRGRLACMPGAWERGRPARVRRLRADGD